MTCLKNRFFFGLEYKGNETLNFVRKIKTLCLKTIPGWLNINSYFKSKNSLGTLFAKKFKKYNKFESPCVYKLKCKNCTKSYVGETGRTLEIRKHEHEKLKEYSAVSNHVREFGHEIDFQNPGILINESNLRKRKILESLFLKKTDHFEGNVGWQLNVF